jgi:1-acyl-sn-glycerol-3-phosphate acyltransferase
MDDGALRETERCVAEFVVTVAPEVGNPPPPEAVLSELGLDSLAVADLALALEGHFGVRLADRDSAALRTVGDVARQVREEPRPGPLFPAGLGRMQRWMKAVPGRLIGWFFRMEVDGAEHVPSTGPVVLAANHRSMWDIPMHVIASPRPIQFMAKRELFRPPFPAIWWTLLGGFSVRRDIADLRAVDIAEAVLERGEVLGIYPEGKRSKTGEMLPFLRGAAWLALRTGAPIVPTGIMGTARRGPWGRRPSRRPVRVRFGPAIAVAREEDPLIRRKQAEALTEDLLEAITALVEE